MLYKFRSRATGDVLMLGPQGDQLLRLIGREPAPRGIIEPPALPAAIEALQQAVARDEAERREAIAAIAAGAPSAADESHPAADPVPLRRRVWPMVEMFKRAQEAGEPVVWGV